MYLLYRSKFLVQFYSSYLSPGYLCAVLEGHPYRVISISYPEPHHFHGGNTGSNPVGDPSSISFLHGLIANLAQSAFSNILHFSPFGRLRLLVAAQGFQRYLGAGTMKNYDCNLQIEVAI